MANNALIGAVRAEATLEGGKFVSGAKKIRQEAKATETQLKKSFGGIAGIAKAGLAGLVSGLSLGLLTQGIKNALQYAGSLGEVAQQLGVTTKELQVFRYAVQQNGGTIEQADQALGKFSVSISKAVSGSAQMQKVFAGVGVSLADLESKSRTEILGQIADKMVATGGAAKNAAAGVAIFGRGFNTIIPTLDLGSKGFNEVAAAAEKLGIIMDDALIQQADEASDKLDALGTILKTQVSVAIAESSGEILELGNAFSGLIGFIADAIGYLNAFRAALNGLQAKRTLLNPFASKEDKDKARVDLFHSRLDAQQGLGVFKPGAMAGSAKSSGGGGPSQFLASGGGGGRSKRAPRDTSLRDAFQFEEEQRRADIDILRAKQDLAHDYVERTAISIQILNLEKEGFEADLKYRVASKDITQAQADALKLKNDEVDHLNRMAVLDEEEANRQRDYNMLDEKDFDIKMGRLQREADLAETASERRDIELRILDLAYEEERRRLNRIIEESKDWAEIEAARRELLALSKNQSLDRQGVISATRGPMEDYLASLPTTAAKAQEALERLEVQGFEGLIDAAVALTDGFDSAKDALLGTLKQFLQGILRMQLQRGLGSLLGQSGFNLGSIFGGGGFGSGSTGTGAFSATSTDLAALGYSGLPGFAGGGSFRVMGRPGIDNNALMLNGIPIANVSYGERVSVSNDNVGGRSHGRGLTQNFKVFAKDADSFHRSEGQILRTARRRLGV